MKVEPKITPFQAAHVLAKGLFLSILAADSAADCETLASGCAKLRGFLTRIHPDLQLDLIHLASMRSEKIEPRGVMTPASAIDGYIAELTASVGSKLSQP